MRKKRERLEVIYDIIDTVRQNGKIGPTRLLQISNLSPQMFREYLSELLHNGLLEEFDIKGRKIYRTTEDGCRFLERYKIFTDFIGKLGL